MEPTRRNLLQSIGLCLAGFVAGRPIFAAPGNPEAQNQASRLRASLQANRERIRTLYLNFEVKLLGTEGWSEDARWLIQGRTELAYQAPGLMWVVSHHEGMTTTELLKEGRFFRGMEAPDGSRPPRVTYDGPAGQQSKPGMSIEVFLPVPDDKPMYDLGSQQLDGQTVAILGQGDRRYYVTTEPPVFVRRLERYQTESRLGARVEFLEPEASSAKVVFPRTVLAQELDADGKPRSPMQFTVLELRVNESIPRLSTSFADRLDG